jgi:hypothetical protein
VHEIIYGLEPKSAVAQLQKALHALVTGNTEDFEAIQRTGLALIIENLRKP